MMDTAEAEKIINKTLAILNVPVEEAKAPIREWIAEYLASGQCDLKKLQHDIMAKVWDGRRERFERDGFIPGVSQIKLTEMTEKPTHWLIGGDENSILMGGLKFEPMPDGSIEITECV